MALPDDFPSAAFCRRIVEAFNEDPDAAAAASGWTGDFGLVVDRPGEVLCAWIGRPEEGRLPAPEFPGEAELLARQPAWFARASEETWRALIEGGLDPIAAIVQNRLEVRGDLRAVVERLKYRGVAARWLERIRRGGR